MIYKGNNKAVRVSRSDKFGSHYPTAKEIPAYTEDLMAWGDEIQIIGSAPSHWKEGEEIKEGEYREQKQCLWSYGQGSAWVDVSTFDYYAEPEKTRRTVLYPIQPQDAGEEKSQDELWNEVNKILGAKWSFSFPQVTLQEFKSKYIIQKRKT